MSSFYRTNVRKIEKYLKTEDYTESMLEAINSKVKTKILKFLTLNKDKEFILSDIAKYVKISKSRASEVLREQEEREVVKSRLIGKSIIYSLNLENENTKLILEFFERSRSGIEKILEEFVLSCKKKFSKNLVSVILFGSYARGTAHEHSDIDLLVVLNKLPEDWREKDKLMEEEVIFFLNKYHERIFPVLTTAEALEKNAEWPNPLFYGILLGYKAIYNPSYFENVMKTVKFRVKEKRPIYVESGKKWQLARI